MKENKIVKFAKELVDNLSPSEEFEKQIRQIVYEQVIRSLSNQISNSIREIPFLEMHEGKICINVDYGFDMEGDIDRDLYIAVKPYYPDADYCDWHGEDKDECADKEYAKLERWISIYQETLKDMILQKELIDAQRVDEGSV